MPDCCSNVLIPQHKLDMAVHDWTLSDMAGLRIVKVNCKIRFLPDNTLPSYSSLVRAGCGKGIKLPRSRENNHGLGCDC
jgi:hypothetical protein